MEKLNLKSILQPSHDSESHLIPCNKFIYINPFLVKLLGVVSLLYSTLLKLTGNGKIRIKYSLGTQYHTGN